MQQAFDGQRRHSGATQGRGRALLGVAGVLLVSPLGAYSVRGQHRASTGACEPRIEPCGGRGGHRRRSRDHPLLQPQERPDLESLLNLCSAGVGRPTGL